MHLEVNVTGGTCFAQAEGNIKNGIILNNNTVNGRESKLKLPDGKLIHGITLKTNSQQREYPQLTKRLNPYPQQQKLANRNLLNTIVALANRSLQKTQNAWHSQTVAC